MQRPNSNKEKNNTDQKLLAVAVDDDDLLTERIQILQKTTEKHCSTVQLFMSVLKWSKEEIGVRKMKIKLMWKQKQQISVAPIYLSRNFCCGCCFRGSRDIKQLPELYG